MEFLISNWVLIVAAIAVIVACGIGIYNFIKKPTSEQMSKLKEWLLYAVISAEKELGSGTGQIKLRYVYDMFIVKFPYLSKVISFEVFSSLVDEALDKIKDILDSNDQLQKYIDK